MSQSLQQRPIEPDRVPAAGLEDVLLSMCSLAVSAGLALSGAGHLYKYLRDDILQRLDEIVTEARTFEGGKEMLGAGPGFLLYCYFLGLGSGAILDDDLREMGRYRADEVLEGLRGYCEHWWEGWLLCQLLGASYYKTGIVDGEYYYGVDGRVSRYSPLMIKVRAGLIIQELTVLDPHMAVCGPGLGAVLENWQVDGDSLVALEDFPSVLETIKGTLRRLAGTEVIDV
jgi:hypothetical protein